MQPFTNTGFLCPPIGVSFLLLAPGHGEGPGRREPGPEQAWECLGSV